MLILFQNVLKKQKLYSVILYLLKSNGSIIGQSFRKFVLEKYIYSLALFFFFFFPVFCFSLKNQSPPAIPYMDQVINRKKSIIIEKCSKHTTENTKGFIMIEIKALPKKPAKARLIATELDNKEFLDCILSILNRIQFKKMTEYPVARIYRFFVL